MYALAARRYRQKLKLLIDFVLKPHHNRAFTIPFRTSYIRSFTLSSSVNPLFPKRVQTRSAMPWANLTGRNLTSDLQKTEYGMKQKKEMCTGQGPLDSSNRRIHPPGGVEQAAHIEHNDLQQI